MTFGLKPDDAFGYLQKRQPSPMGSREARVYRSGAYVGEIRLVLDGQQIDTGEILLMAFSPDDRRFAYVKQQKEDQALIENGRVVATGRELRGPWFSPDGAHLAYLEIISQGAGHIEIGFIDGQEVERYAWFAWGLDTWNWLPPWDPLASPMPDDFRKTRDDMARNGSLYPRK